MVQRITQHPLQNTMRAALRVIALLLCLCFVLSMTPALSVSAAGESSSKATNKAGNQAMLGESVSGKGVSCTNTYLVRFTTGVNSGALVRYIAIRYVDSKGVSRAEIILPHDQPKKSTIERAMKNGSAQKHLDTVDDAIAYTVDIEAEKNADALRANTTDEILITPHYQVKEIVSMDVYEQYGNKGWTCAGIDIYKVEWLHGMEMMGYYSNSLYVDFSGKCIFTYAKNTTLNLSGSDKLFRFSPKSVNESYKLIPGNNADYTTDDSSEYLFELDIADVYMAGIEKLFRDGEWFADTKFCQCRELFNIELTYIDTAGSSHKVWLPVFTSAAAWGTEHGFTQFEREEIYNSLLQQGEQLVFSGKLPGFDRVKECRLHYTADAASQAGITCDNEIIMGADSYDDADLKDELFSISAFKMYRNVASSQIHYTGPAKSSQFFYDIDADPIAYYLSEKESGITLSPGTYKPLAINENDGAIDLSPNYDGRYVVVIKTDTPATAGTMDEVNIRFTYQSTAGVSKTTKVYSLSTAPQNFYGYWPYYDGDASKTTVLPNFYHLWGLRAGGEIAFFLDAEDVSSFQSFEVSMSSNSKDDWQMKSLIIYDPETIGHRLFNCKSQASVGKWVSDWNEITRDFDKSTIVCSYGIDNGESGENELPIYVDGDDEETSHHVIRFDDNGGGGGSEPSENEIDWNKLKNSMTYKEALQDLGFNRTRATYEVEVQVAGNESANDQDGDTGSNNLFYFQLAFQNGSSAFVLANQQLTADGFRAGELESFSISTNQDYGDLTAIRILPDDSDANENTDIFDKLNIQSITVSKKSSAIASTAWKFDNVGWIKIDYRDNAPKNTAAGLAGRSSKELVREFTTTGKGVSTNLMFAITTDYYGESAEEHDSPYRQDELQLEGTVTATVLYDTNEGQKTKSFDVVKKMYEYNGQTANYTSKGGDLSAKYTDENGDETACAVSDTNFMWRGGHTDRFFVNLTDVTSVQSIELKVRGTKSTAWRIKDVSVYQVLQNGTLRLNSVNEYQRHTPSQISLVANSASDAYDMVVPGDKKEATLPVINFTSNTIKNEEGSGGWSSTITREPDNRNDTLNLYVYMADGAKDPIEYSGGKADRKYDIKAVMEYSVKDKDTITSSTLTNMNYDSVDKVLYANGITTYGFRSLSKLTLSVPSVTKVNALVDHAIVQHVRSGVVISSYYMDFHVTGSTDPINVFAGVSRSPDNGLSRSDEKQVVSVLFGKDTVSSGLTAEKSDIAVALRYKLKGDPTGKEYNSPYIFLTDVKEKKVTQTADGQETVQEVPYAAVRPGMVAEIPFYLPNVKEITGVIITSTGAVSAQVDGMTVGCYSLTGATQEPTAWYSFAGSQKLSTTPVIMSVTDINVVPIELSVVTASSTDTVSTSTSDPIRLTVGYVSQDGRQTRTMTIEDARMYLVSGATESKKTATFRFFIKNFGEIRYITIEPYSKGAYSRAAWGIDTLTVRSIVNGNSRVTDRTLSDVIIREGEPRTINLCNISISTKTSFYNSQTKKSSTVNSDSKGWSSVLVYSGDEVKIKPTLSGSLAGYGYFVSAVKTMSGATAEVTCYKQGDGQIIFETPRNLTDTAETYRVLIESEENATVRAIVEICVAPENDATLQTTTATQATSTEATSAEPTGTGAETEPTGTEM